MSDPLERYNQFVENTTYKPEKKRGLRFEMDYLTFMSLRGVFDAIKAKPGFEDLEESPDDKEVWFGFDNAEKDHNLAIKFGLVNPESTPVKTRSRSKSSGKGGSGKYPFDKLENVGDHFLVKNRSPKYVSVLVHFAMQATRHVYRVVTVSEGSLVILVEGPGLSYAEVVHD